MNKIKTSKGITLIALIITIIVLLILAVVAINSVNKTGIINYAQNAVDDYRAGQTKENEAIQGYMEYLEKYDPSNKNNDNGSKDRLVAMYKAGTLKIGDYVNYTPNGATSYKPDGDVAGSQTLYTDELQIIQRDNLSWRVLGYDEVKDQVLLISSEPTFNGLLKFGEPEDDADYISFIDRYATILDNTCNTLYGNTEIGAEARSITGVDIRKLLRRYKYKNSTRRYR